ncbi:MAG TPA: hypothetical protein VH877_18440 [Polyangia bacterium]|jgi:hypothetical protein|nr:hypothetical protein [Polyangia bacterium]
MSDFARGWLIEQATLDELRAFCTSRRITTFLAPARGGRARLFPAYRDTSQVTGAIQEEPTLEQLLAELPHARVLSFAASDDDFQAAAWVAGAPPARIRLPVWLRDDAAVLAARRALRPLTRVFTGARPTASLRVGESAAAFVFTALGAFPGELRHLNYSLLMGDRLAARHDVRHQGLIFLDGAGGEEPFAVDLPRDADAAPRDRAAAELVGATTTRQWLDHSKRLDPAQASAAVIEHLEEILQRGVAFRATADQKLLVREAAARLLGRIAAAQPAWCERFLGRATQALGASSGEARAAWALALRDLTPDPALASAVSHALAEETDPRAVRRLFEVHARIRHEPGDAELLRWSEAPEALVRKGAYALLEQAATPRLRQVLRRRLKTEPDPGAREVLARVLRALREQEE